jgi:hypothetical protein
LRTLSLTSENPGLEHLGIVVWNHLNTSIPGCSPKVAVPLYSIHVAGYFIAHIGSSAFCWWGISENEADRMCWSVITTPLKSTNRVSHIWVSTDLRCSLHQIGCYRQTVVRQRFPIPKGDEHSRIQPRYLTQDDHESIYINI